MSSTAGWGSSRRAPLNHSQSQQRTQTNTHGPSHGRNNSNNSSAMMMMEDMTDEEEIDQHFHHHIGPSGIDEKEAREQTRHLQQRRPNLVDPEVIKSSVAAALTGNSNNNSSAHGSVNIRTSNNDGAEGDGTGSQDTRRKMMADFGFDSLSEASGDSALHSYYNSSSNINSRAGSRAASRQSRHHSHSRQHSNSSIHSSSNKSQGKSAHANSREHGQAGQQGAPPGPSSVHGADGGGAGEESEDDPLTELFEQQKESNAGAGRDGSMVILDPNSSHSHRHSMTASRGEIMAMDQTSTNTSLGQQPRQHRQLQQGSTTDSASGNGTSGDIKTARDKGEEGDEGSLLGSFMPSIADHSVIASSSLSLPTDHSEEGKPITALYFAPHHDL